MYSVKPGRGPSFMGGAGGIAAAAFGVVWTISAASAGAPPAFVLFGLFFILLAAAGAIYNFHNATARDRMSLVDITSAEEEPDPIARALGRGPKPAQGSSVEPGRDPGPRRFPGDHCPFCGTAVEPSFDYCPKCGNDI